MTMETTSEPTVVGFLNLQFEPGVVSQESRLDQLALALRRNLSDAALIGVCEVEGQANGDRLADQLGMESFWVSNEREDELLGVLSPYPIEAAKVPLDARGRYNACVARVGETAVAVVHLPYQPFGGGPRRRRQIAQLARDEQFAGAESAVIMGDMNHCARLPFRRSYFGRFGFSSAFDQLGLRHYPTVATPDTRQYLKRYERIAMTLGRHPGFSVDDIYTSGSIQALELTSFIAASDHLGLRAELEILAEPATIAKAA